MEKKIEIEIELFSRFTVRGEYAEKYYVGIPVKYKEILYFFFFIYHPPVTGNRIKVTSRLNIITI